MQLLRLNVFKILIFVLIFFSATEFFRRTGSKVLPRVGNTVRKALRIPQNKSAVSFKGNAGKCFGDYKIVI